MAFLQTTAASISSGGTINGDLTIEGDLTVNGDGAGAYDEIINGNLRLDTPGSSATTLEFVPTGGQASQIKFFQDDGSTQDARIFAPEGAQDLAFEAGTTEMMRMTTTGVGIGNSPDVNFHIKLGDTANARIEDTSSDGIAKLDFKNDVRQATIGVYGDDSDNFKIDHGGGAVLIINTAQQVGIGVTPTTPLHVKVNTATTDTTNGLLIEQDGTGDAVAQFLLTDTKRYMMGIDNSDSDNFVIMTGASDLSSGNRVTFNSDMDAVFPGTLTVNGDLADISGAHPTLKLTDSDDSNYASIGYSDGALSIQTNGGDESGAADTIVFYNHGSTERMKLLSNGSLQIGTAGNTTDVQLMVNNKILIHQDSGGAGDSELTFDRRHDGAVARIQAKAGASGAMGTELHFVTKLAGGSEGTALVLDDNQKAGIGTTAPDSLLHIFKADASQTAHSDSLLTLENSGNTYMTILSGNANHGQIHFGDDGQNDDGVVGYDQNASKFYILTNHSSTKKLVVDANGNVGIGTSSPASAAGANALDIVDTNTSSATQGASLRLGSNDEAGAMGDGHRLGVISFRGSEDGAGTMTEGARIDAICDAAWSDTENGASLRFFTTDGNASESEQMRIDSLGNMGLGVVPDTTWLSTRTALQIGGSGCIFGRTSTGSDGDLSIGENVYQHSGGSYRSISEDEATLYRQSAGVHEFKVTASVTDNATISFTDVAKFDINSRISLSNNDNNSNNTVFGKSAFNAGSDNDSDQNVAIGDLAMGTGSVAGARNNVAIGYLALTDVTEGDNSVIIGKESGTNLTTGSGNVAIGTDSLKTTTESSNVVAIGMNTGNAINNTDADGTVAVGKDSLKALTSGRQSTGVGYKSLNAVTDGDKNTAFGYEAGLKIAGGSNNAVFGSEALKNEDGHGKNTAIGTETLFTLNAGADGHNTALGYQAGSSMNTGTSNTVIGSLTGDAITSGTNNVVVGKGSDISAVDGTNQIVLGEGVTGVGDNSVTLGNNSVTDVYMAQDKGATVHLANINFFGGGASSSGANVLDDYEEGDHTVSGTDDSGTFTLQSGGDTLTYTKIGRQVTVAGELQINDLSSAGSGGLRFSLPFAVADQTETGDRFVGTVQTRNVDYSANVVSCCVKAVVGTQYFYVVEIVDNGMESALASGSFSTNDEVTVTLTYFTT